MSERDEKRGGAGCAIGLVLVLLFALVLYVLSVGPVVALVIVLDCPYLFTAGISREGLQAL